jgi:hypothetical protein
MEDENKQNEAVAHETASEHQLTKRERRKLKKEAEELRKHSESKKKKTKKLLYVSIIVGLVVLGGWYVSTIEVAPLPGEKIVDLGNQHIDSVDTPHTPYNTKPPTSGPHTGLAPWGISNQQLPDETQVHNLEDGGVGIQYSCPNGCSDLVNQLGDIAEDYDRVFLGPYADLENAIALTAWGRIDSFDKFDEERIRNFIESYVGIDHHKR